MFSLEGVIFCGSCGDDRIKRLKNFGGDQPKFPFDSVLPPISPVQLPSVSSPFYLKLAYITNVRQKINDHHKAGKTTYCKWKLRPAGLLALVRRACVQMCHLGVTVGKEERSNVITVIAYIE